MTSWLRFPSQRPPEQQRPHYGRRQIRKVAHASEKSITCITFENYTLGELVRHLETSKVGPALVDLQQKYDVRRSFPDMSNFRMGPNTFGETALDWIAFVAAGAQGPESELIAHGVATRISWNGDASTLPRGWIGAVRQSYEQSVLQEVRATTLVGLFINAGKAFQKHGWAAQVTGEMKRLVTESGLRDLIIPLRLPTRYDHQNAKMPYEEFAFMKRENGEYRDHWLRMHVRVGAEVIGFSSVSHQHALHPDDLDQQLHCGRKEQTGDYLVKWNEEYYNVYIDVEREFALINQGCVWVRHALGPKS